MSTYLLFIPPILAVIYRWLEHLGVIDKMTGRDLAKDGLKRLKSTSGFPKSWIHNKDQDVKIFRAIEKRISKNSNQAKVISLLKDGYKPSLISTAGSSIEIKGVPPEWAQEEKFSYLPNQPILYIFDIEGSKTGQKGEKACTLEELDTWLKDEKDNRTFWLGAFLLGLISIILTLIRVNIAS